METTQNKKITYIWVLIAILIFGYVIYAVMQSNKNKNMETNATTTDQLMSNEPRIAQAEDIIVINYSGKLANGTEFDSSYTRGQPFVFQVGVGQVIKGWDEGLIGVKKGA